MTERETYRRHAGRYERRVRLLEPLRREAVGRLDLERGHTVIDVACGTGLSFPLLERGVGPSGRIVGVDASPDMLAQARARSQASDWRNIEFVESAIEHFATQVTADAALFALTHDVMQSPVALERVLARLKPSARIVTFGARRPSGWALPVDLVVRIAARPFIANPEGLDRPWGHLERLVPDLHVETALFGGAYLAWGRTPPGPRCDLGPLA